MLNKQQQVTATIDKLKRIARDALVKGKYNRAMAAINAGCRILYNWNQYYVDEDFESLAQWGRRFLGRMFLTSVLYS